MTVQQIEEVFRGLKPRCTCGWPAISGSSNHAPDCEIESKWDQAVGIVEDQGDPGCFECGATVAMYEDLCPTCKPGQDEPPAPQGWATITS